MKQLVLGKRPVFGKRPLWTLTLRWFWQSQARTSRVKRGLFRGSLRLAILSMALGVGAVSFTMALLSGYESVVARGVAGARGDATLRSLGTWFFWEQFEAVENSYPARGIKRLEYFWNAQGLILGPDGRRGRGVVIEGVRSRESFAANSDSVGADSNANLADPVDPVVKVSLGGALADIIGAKPGDTIKVLLPGILRGAIPAQVESIQSFGMYEMDSQFMRVAAESLVQYMRAYVPQDLDRLPGEFQGVRFFLDQSLTGFDRLPQLSAWTDELRSNLRVNDVALSGDVIVRTWWDEKRNLFGSVEFQKQSLLLVMGILALIAGLNMASVLFVLFLERDRDFAIIRAMGMNPGRMTLWILQQGAVLGLIGASLGVVGSMILSVFVLRLPLAQLPFEVYQITELPFRFYFEEQAKIWVAGVVMACVVAGGLGLILSRVNLLRVLGHRR